MSDEKNLFAHVDPARRDFLKKLLAGAAFAAPVIATFSIEALTADKAYGTPSPNSSNTTNITNQICAGDVGYVGPTNFQAHVAVGPVFTPVENRVNGEANITVYLNSPSSVGEILVNVQMVPFATVNSVTILAELLPAATMTGGSSFILTTSNLNTRVACDLDELADLIASGGCVLTVEGSFSGRPYTATGVIVVAPSPTLP